MTRPEEPLYDPIQFRGVLQNSLGARALLCKGMLMVDAAGVKFVR